MGISPIGLIFALSFIIVLFLSYFNTFELKIEKKNILALIFPFLLTIILYLLIAFGDIFVLMLFIVFSLFLVFYYIKDNESIFSYLYIKTSFKAFITLISLFILGGILFNLVRFNQVDNEIVAILIFFIGTYLFLLARFGIVSLTSQIALNKGRNKFWGLLGVIGVIGLFIVYLLPKVKNEA